MASEWFAAAVLIFGAILGAYALDRGSNRLLPSGRGLHEIRQYVPPVVIELRYRNETGIKTQRRVAVLKSLRHSDGRLLLLGICGGRQPRTFRVDRIVEVATPDGEILDTRRFLTGSLDIPPKMIARLVT